MLHTFKDNKYSEHTYTLHEIKRSHFEQATRVGGV